MFAESSPATVIRAEGRLVPGASPKTYRAPSAAPTTPQEANDLLTRVERILEQGRATDGLLEQITRFLGANSAAWTPVHRARLRRALAGFDGRAAVDAIVAMMLRHPRTDILDEAELALRGLDVDAAQYMRRLVEREPGLEAGIRARLLGAVVRSDPSGSAGPIYFALRDPDAELREAAVALAVEFELPNVLTWLEQRLERESSATVKDAIRDALASFER
jgi:hypothetical protein